MSIKKFFKKQFQLKRFTLRHEVTSDFYLSCFQRSHSTAPLIIVRTVICAGCLATWIASMVLTRLYMPLQFWPIYLTHWGLIMNTVAAGCGLFVSVMAGIKLPIDHDSGLPWYVQVYWVMFNIATPIAFFITIFYWTLLSAVVDQSFAFDYTLDIFIHGINSVVMGALLISSSQPAYFFHFYIPIGFGIIYLLFSYIYFISGGTDAFGHHTIYPMIDWEKPAETVGLAALCTIGIIILHGVVVALTAGRDILTAQFKKETTTHDFRKP